jgi:hypothetical protein
VSLDKLFKFTMLLLPSVIYFSILTLASAVVHKNGDNIFLAMDSYISDVKKLCDLLPSANYGRLLRPNNVITGPLYRETNICLYTDSFNLEKGVIEIDAVIRTISDNDYLTITVYDTNLSGINAVVKRKNIYGHNALQNGLQKILMDVTGVNRSVFVSFSKLINAMSK